MRILELENVSLEIKDRKILQDISLQLDKGKITTLVGPNGGGKTSIARIVAGIIKPSSGRIIKYHGLTTGYMPQRVKIDRTIPLKVLDFLKLYSKDNNLNYKFIELLNCQKFLNRQIHDLSGGQMQKILFLRSLIDNPQLLILDEPTQYMDIPAIDHFYRIIEEIRDSKECSILLVSHDIYTVMQKTDLVLCVNHHICCHGLPADVNQHPEYLSLFGNRTNLGVYQHHHDHKH